METIYQSIEILSKEKGIDVQIVLDAVKDAMLIAARKHFRTEEDYVAELDDKTGAIRFFPDGGSDGGRVTIAAGERKYEVDIDWLTGRVAILD